MEELNIFDELLTLLEKKEYAKLRESLSEHNDADIAAWMEDLSEEHMLKLFRILTKDQAADVFSYLDSDIQQRIIKSMSDKEAAGIIDNLMADDAADLFEEMLEEQADTLLTFDVVNLNEVVSDKLKSAIAREGRLLYAKV